MARKAVLAYMADRANDDGSGIWASKQRIADEIEASKKTVIRIVKELEADGLLEATGKRRTQGGHTVVYRIVLSEVQKLQRTIGHDEGVEVDENQSHHAPTNQSHGVTGPKMHRSHGVLQSSPTVSPKPSRNRPIGLADAKPKRAKVIRPDEVSAAIWRDYNRQRRKPITDTALEGLKREAAKAGWPLEDALQEATMRGWDGFKASWVEDRKPANSSASTQRGGSLADIGNEVRQLYAQ